MDLGMDDEYGNDEPEVQIEPMEESTEIVIEAPTVEELVADYSPETVDLLDALTTEEQKKCAERVVEDTQTDEDSSQKWRERHAQILKLALGDLPPPEEGSFAKARIHYGIIMKANMRLGARIYDQQFPSNGEFFGAKPTDALDLARSVRVAKHLNWQTLHQIPEYVPNHDACIRQTTLYGSAFTYVYWNPVKQRICHEVCNSEDIIIQYFVRKNSVDPSLADIPRITRRIRKYRHELEEMADVGYYKHVEDIYKEADENPDNQSTSQTSPRDSSKSTPIQDVVDKDAGVKKPENGKGLPRILLEQHCWYKFPKTKRERPVIITVDKESKTLLSIRLRENEEPADQARYNREKQANQAAYELAMQRYSMDMAAYLSGQTQAPMPMGDPTMTPLPMQGPETMTAPPMPGEMTPTMPVTPVAPPVEPPPPLEPEPPRMVPIHFFTHYICEPNPEGIYGIGIGALLEGPNIAADVMASQMVDAGTLSNTVTGIASREAKMGSGDIEIAPGVINKTELMPGELKDAFHFFDFKGPEPMLGKFIQDMKDEGEELSGASDILSGEVGGSNETATTTQIRMSAAMMAVGILNKRYTRSRTCEAQKIARLNSVYLKDKEYFPVVDPFKLVPTSDAEVTFDDNGQPEVPGLKSQQISRVDYLEDVDITITADPRMASQPQRVQEATQAFQMFATIPYFQANPVFMSALAKNILIAMDRPELIRALETTPMMPPMMPGAPPPGGPPPGPQGGPPQPANPGTAVPNAGPQPENGAMTT